MCRTTASLFLSLQLEERKRNKLSLLSLFDDSETRIVRDYSTRCRAHCWAYGMTLLFNHGNPSWWHKQRSRPDLLCSFGWRANLWSRFSLNHSYHQVELESTTCGRSFEFPNIYDRIYSSWFSKCGRPSSTLYSKEGHRDQSVSNR